MGFLQDGVVVAELGSDFRSGAVAGPYEVKLKKGYETHLALTDQIYWCDFLGVKLQDGTGNVLYELQPGRTLWEDTVYHTFCAGCE